MTGWRGLAARLGLLLAAASAESATYVGSGACISCHADQGRQWGQSHHARSMQLANRGTVKGNFNNVKIGPPGQASRFFMRQGRYWVNTRGPDGRLRDFQIRYTFGIYPLQQYLVALPGGRLQALGTAWDSRSRAEGGQRWFSLYPGQELAPGDAIHWTGRDQNWNFMCASCHSTGVSRNFNLAANRFDTRWQEINVACEACHGPGSSHRDLARAGRPGRGAQSGLSGFTAGAAVQWVFVSPEQKIASPRGDVAAAKRQEEACYGCHARRQELTAGPGIDRPFLDNYLPSLLEKGLYHPDGQINDEVFEYGSFVQSRMHKAGVSCTNCHQAHSAKLKVEGNALCAQCHKADYYDRAAHHHHETTSPAARCVACHMPSKTYMGVHVRRDHGMRIPRPDLTPLTGAPNACNQCHQEKDAAWASVRIEAWTGRKPDTAAHFAPGLAAAWEGNGSVTRLAPALAAESAAMLRAAALPLLPPSAGSPALVRKAAADPDGLVRIGAARALASLPADTAADIGSGLLADPLRAVRIEAARTLAGLPDPAWPAGSRQRFDLAFHELVQAELAAAERPESHVNLGQLYARMGRAQEAEASLHTALRLAQEFVPALLNLAELYRATGRDREGESLLRKAVLRTPPSAEAAHALGLLLIRQGRLPEALPWLERAVELAPQNDRYARIQAMALQEAGRQVLKKGD